MVELLRQVRLQLAQNVNEAHRDFFVHELRPESVRHHGQGLRQLLVVRAKNVIALPGRAKR